MRFQVFLCCVFCSLVVFAQIHPGRKDVAPSGTLPIVHINTVNNTVIDQKDTYIDATLWIDASMTTEFESLGTEQEPVALGIRGRGNSSWGQDKKPYKIKFNKKQKVLGMPKSKHWALLNNTADIQNTVDAMTYKFAELTMDIWIPRFQMVEAVLNDYNIGVYWLCETIRIEDTRVNIFEQEDMNEDVSVVHGGWIMEIDNAPSPETEIVLDNIPVRKYAAFTPKSPELLSGLQREWITKELNAMNDAVINGTWDQFFDLESAAKYIAIQELAGNFDGFVGSTYFYKDLADEKWTFGPLWDMGFSMQTSDMRGWSWEQRAKAGIDQVIERASVWLPEMMRHKGLQEALKKQFSIFASFWPQVEAYGKAFHESLQAAYAVDRQIWPQYVFKGYSIRWERVIKPRYANRIEWLQSPGIFDSLTSGIDVVKIGDAVAVETMFYSASGKRILHPADGEPHIEVSLMSDGTYSVSKKF